MFLKESPYFEIPVQNVTARVGRTAKLTCVVENLGHFKVAWGYKVTGAVLTVATQVITKNTRISVQREQQSTWVLTISNVTMKDQGDYWCQVNTSPPRSISGYLSVVGESTLFSFSCISKHNFPGGTNNLSAAVCPLQDKLRLPGCRSRGLSFQYFGSGSVGKGRGAGAEPPVMESGNEEVTITSGEIANLTCRARGTPTPTIRWIREDYDRIRINATYFASDYIGNSLLLRSVNHRSAGGYLCIASNGHPPSISRRVIVHVKYKPLIQNPPSSLWASQGSSISLTCLYAAYPAPQVMWMRDNFLGSQLLSDEYFTVTPQDGHRPFTHNMTLSMRNLVLSDFGAYTCIIKNSQGEARGTAILREVVTTTTTTPPTTTTTSPPPSYNDYDDNAKNLTAPLVVNTSPDLTRGGPGVQPAPSREQHYGNRKSKNIARINIIDDKKNGGSSPRGVLGVALLPAILHLCYKNLIL
ncbi:hemicentin-2-like [Penaeus monodon]|uniref:hemicentin-2-like n=1 Tax=Penaeus monodon TaxID=6687 RepID=UPI0018A711F2|nr:hemicentin-2-like [Penaeus monodon]